MTVNILKGETVKMVMKLRASKCVVKEVTPTEEKQFLEANHLQGYVMSEVAYGLYYDNELVQIETFGMPRIEAQAGSVCHDWELLRECSKKDVQVYGGKSRLLKHFESEKKPLNLLSYCDTTAGFDGHSYAACGFVLEHKSMDYWYEYNGEVIKRYRMQKNASFRAKGKKEPIQATLEKYGKTYDPNLTEKQNATNAGFVLKTGTGQQVWSKRFSDNIGYIYLIENTVNGKLYVGQHTLYKNGVVHRKYYWASGTAINKATEKYGKKAFKRRAIVWTSDLSKLDELEQFYIEKYRQEVGQENMYNLDFTGVSGRQKWRDDEYKTLLQGARISKAVSGVPKSERHKNAISETVKQLWKDGVFSETGKKVSETVARKKKEGTYQNSGCFTEGHENSPEVRQKISEALKGRKKAPFSEEHKAKLAEVARQQRIDELNKIHALGYKTKDELFEHFHCTKRTYKKVVPTEILETIVKFGKWNCYKF